MSFRFTKGIFKICVAQICQNVGWQAVQTSPMDIVIDVLHRYLRELSKAVQKYSNQYGRTEPNLDDVALAFKDFGISLSEIEEYVTNVDAVPFVRKLPPLPIEHLPKLQHPKLNSRELLHRSEGVYEYLPLMHPELEEEEGLLSPAFDGVSKKTVMDSSGATDGDASSPLSSPKHGTKRPNEWPNDIPVAKKNRHFVEEEGRPMREVTSVFMSPTGFISPVREGKAAEPSLPNTIDSPPSTPEPPVHTLDVSSSKKESKSKDSKKDKSSKSKKEKEQSKKDSKKAKSSKKENKENTALLSEKSGATSFTVKEKHSSSHKSSSKSEKATKSCDLSRPKNKCDKTKVKESKEEHKKNHPKIGKSKSKYKHMSSSLARSPKPPKVSKSPQKSPQKYVAKSPKKASSKSPKSEKKASTSPPAVTSVPVKKEELPPVDIPKPVIQPELSNDEADVSDFQEREESPEPRLVIDISVEAQNRQEKESRMAMFDECIDAVIQRGQEESELENQKCKSFDRTIDEVARGPPVMRRLEPKDIYDFTDSSLSSLSSLEPDDSPMPVPIKKEPYDSSDSDSGDSIKREKVKGKHTKKVKDAKRPSGPLASPKGQKSPNVIVKREERSPSPIKLKEEIYSSDESASSRSHSPAYFFDNPRSQKQSQGPSMNESPPQQSPFMPSSVPSTSYSGNPFAPIRSLPCQIQSNPHFPTPPLFQTSKSDQGSMFQNTSSALPLNLAKPNSAAKGLPESKTPEPYDLSSKADDMTDSKIKKNEAIDDKGSKRKPYLKEKKEKVESKSKVRKKNKEKEKQKVKEKKAVVEPKRERGRPRLDKNVKDEKKAKMKLDKKKEKDEKVQDESSVTKFTLKITSGNTGKCCIKPSAKSTSSQPASPTAKGSSPLPSPSRAQTPSPPSSPPPAPKPASPLPPPSPVPSPTPPTPTEPEVPVVAPIAQTAAKSTHSRGRGRGRKPAAQPAAQPPARTVITETLGTIVDESGNKIWICPACTRPDDGSPMIGCDECDDWYHWVCVGIVVPPKEEESWFCTRCISKRQSVPVKRRRKKHKKDK